MDVVKVDVEREDLEKEDVEKEDVEVVAQGKPNDGRATRQVLRDS